jgi:uncharacterized protein YndB with AHSA1/START domain
MMVNNKTVYTTDAANKQIKVVREFDAPVEQVWKAWTTRELLDQWWAPRPWKANTTKIDFRSGGSWLYYMEGPEGERHYCRADYETVVPNESFSGTDAFCDEQGKINNEFPRMHWDANFIPAGDATRVEVLITFASEEDMNKIIEMGFKEGFEAAHGNLDELLAK